MTKTLNESDNIKRLQSLIKDKNEEIEVLKNVVWVACNCVDIDKILDNMIDTVKCLTKCDASFLYILDQNKQELVLRASKNVQPNLLGKVRLPLGEGIAGWVAQKKQYLMIPDKTDEFSQFNLPYDLPEDKYKAVLSIPILRENEVLGVINIMKKSPYNYSKDIISILDTISQYFGGTIANSYHYDETKKKASEVEILCKISNVVASGKYLEEILNLIVNIVAETMGSKICSIMLLNQETQELSIKATQSLSNEYRQKPPLKVGQSIGGRVVKEKKPIAVLDVTKEKGYMYPEIARKEGLCSMLSVPMIVKGKVIGVINSYTSEKHQFNQSEISILQSVADQSAIAIENARLMEEVLDAKETLNTRKLMERAKSLLIKNKNIPEEEAHKYLIKKSMDNRKSMKEVAEAIILAFSTETK